MVQTKKYKLSELSAESVFDSKKYNNYLQKAPIIGLEYNGSECAAKCKTIVQALNIDLVFVSDQISNSQLDNFYNFAEMQMSV